MPVTYNRFATVEPQLRFYYDDKYGGGVEVNPGVVWLGEVDSTNLYALSRFEEIPDGTMIAAESQTNGRGRRGRIWFSPPGVNLYASQLLKSSHMSSAKASWIGGLAALDTLRTAAAGVAFWLKWPNDIYVDNRKIAGVLCEVRRGHGKTPSGVVIGVGVNVNMSRAELSLVGAPATSLFEETGRRYDLRSFAILMHDKILRYQRIVTDEGGIDHIYNLWRGENALIGRSVRVGVEGGESFVGEARAVRKDGSLVVALADGSHREVRAGDVSVDY